MSSREQHTPPEMDLEITDVPPALRWIKRLWSRWRTPLLTLAVVVVAALVLGGLRHIIEAVDYQTLVEAMRNTPSSGIALAVLATAVSYLALTGYDASALRYAGVHVRRSTVVETAFIAYAIGNSVGLGVMTGGAVRMRLYTAAGVEPAQIFKVIGFNAGAFGLGVLVFGAAGMLWGAPYVVSLIPLPVLLLRVMAAAALLGTAGFIGLCLTRTRLQFGRWGAVSLPPARLVLGQLAISVVDLGACAATLWFLMPSGAVSFSGFIVYFALAISLGVLSHVPGGLGVFEAAILLACGDRVPTESVLGALILYRGIYYLLPLVLATLLLTAHELRRAKAAPVGQAAARLSPVLLAILTFVAGVVLLLSGVTPTTDEAADLLAMHVPLPIVEAAHLIGSVAGLAMLFVARGLLHRLDAAWWAALILAIVAAVLALPKGIAWTEALGLTVLAGLLWFSHGEFTRRSSLFSQTFETGWLIAVGCVIGAALWVLFLAYDEVDYARKLWWQFTFEGDISRSLRAVTAVILAGLGMALWQLFRAPTPELDEPGREMLAQASSIVNHQDSAEACLVLMGDKSLLFSEAGTSLIMYGRYGRTWIALGDPVGNACESPDLVWRFIEMASAHGGRAVFYQASARAVPWYLDAGLRVFKLGEDAYVPLDAFDLKGPKRASLRHALNRAEREGLTLEIIPAAAVEGVLAEIEAISDRWLEMHRTREKGFSLGAFDPAYLQQLPLALARQNDRVVAFANILFTETGEEVSVDLMRHLPDAPPGTMDFMFIRMMLHFQQQGVRRFNLGMAPLAGMARHELAPAWQQFGRLLFEHGERFYNFKGLRSFKAKFDPVWEPRYLAAPGGLAPLIALADIAALISGGLRGVIGK